MKSEVFYMLDSEKNNKIYIDIISRGKSFIPDLQDYIKMGETYLTDLNDIFDNFSQQSETFIRRMALGDLVKQEDKYFICLAYEWAEITPV